MNRLDLEQQKVSYIQAHIPNFKKINPFLDQTSVNEVKKLLYDNGFYQLTRWHYIEDNAVVNLLLIAQGKRKNISKKRKIKGDI